MKYVYGILQVVSEGHAFVKIGVSDDPVRRLAGLQTGSPIKLQFLFVVPGTTEDEQRILRKLGQYRVQGEWLRLTPDVMKELRPLISATHNVESKTYNEAHGEDVSVVIDGIEYVTARQAHNMLHGELSLQAIKQLGRNWNRKKVGQNYYFQKDKVQFPFFKQAAWQRMTIKLEMRNRNHPMRFKDSGYSPEELDSLGYYETRVMLRRVWRLEHICNGRMSGEPFVLFWEDDRAPILHVKVRDRVDYYCGMDWSDVLREQVVTGYNEEDDEDVYLDKSDPKWFDIAIRAAMEFRQQVLMEAA